MNSIPFIPPSWHAKTFGFQAKPVSPIFLCAHPLGAGLVARTRERVRGGLALLLLAGGLAVGSTGLRAESSPASTIHLTSTLVSPIDVALEWKDTSPDAAGHTIEYALNPNGPFIVLSFCPPGQTTYKHPNLMPQTTFYYRVRGIYGPTTDPIEVTLPSELSDAVYADRYSKPEDYSWSGPKTLPDTAPLVKKSLRDAATVAEAAPTDFKAALVPITVSGIQLTWTNHSSDEDGFLLETKDASHPDFTVCARIDPKVNAFGWGLHPPERKTSLRLRAFYYGTPSNLEKQTTVLPSEWKNPTANVAAPSQPAN
jgi:hypothetical protein